MYTRDDLWDAIHEYRFAAENDPDSLGPKVVKTKSEVDKILDQILNEKSKLPTAVKKIKTLNNKALDILIQYGFTVPIVNESWVIQEAIRVLKGWTNEEMDFWLEQKGLEKGIPP